MTTEREPLTQDGIYCWRVNYGLDKSPHDLHDFWRDGAPPGAALALKAAVAEIDRLREECARLRDALQQMRRWMPVYPEAADGIVGVREAHAAAMAAANAALKGKP